MGRVNAGRDVDDMRYEKVGHHHDRVIGADGGPQPRNRRSAERLTAAALAH
jgi:hypothetical protein